MPKTIEEIAGTLQDSRFPRQIALELSAHCNLKCIMCPHPSMEREKGFMSDDLYRKCVDEIAHESKESELWLADHGESLITGTAVVDKARYAKEKGLPKVYLNTNGMLLTREISRGLVDAGLDGVFFGLDAATRDTHAAIRCGGDLDVIVGNIDDLLEERARGANGKPSIWVQFIEMDENEGERDAFVDFWSGKDVGVKVRRKLSWGACIRSSSVEGMDEARIPCQWIMNLMHVLWDGRVCRCGGDHECHYPMGNVYESSIASIWQGPLKEERAVQLRYEFDKLNDQCKQCIDWKVGAAEKLSPL